MAVKVTLNAEDAERAFQVGTARADRAERHGWTRNVHSTIPNHERHREAAASELAVARFVDGEWVDDLNAFRRLPDVLPDLEVRRVTFRKAHLFVYPEDADDRRFVMVYGASPTFEIVGWVWGHERKTRGAWDTFGGKGPGIWCVPAARLRDPSQLSAQARML